MRFSARGALIAAMFMALMAPACAPQTRDMDQGRLPLPPEAAERVTDRYDESAYARDILDENLTVDFTAGRLDSHMWGCLEGGDCRTDENGVTVTGQGAEAGVYSSFFLPQSFSLEVSFEMDEIPPAEGGVGLLLANPGIDGGVVLGRAWTRQRDVYGAGLVRNRALRSDHVFVDPTADLSGELRLVAGDGTAVCLYKQDGEWKELTRFDLPEGPLRLYLLLRAEPGAQARFTACEIKIF